MLFRKQFNNLHYILLIIITDDLTNIVRIASNFLLRVNTGIIDDLNLLLIALTKNNNRENNPINRKNYKVIIVKYLF